MADILSVSDLIAGRDAIVEELNAAALRHAPCLADLETGDPKLIEARGILRTAALRRDAAGDGVTTTEATGPFSETRSIGEHTTSVLTPVEVAQLAALCDTRDGGAVAPRGCFPAGAIDRIFR